MILFLPDMASEELMSTADTRDEEMIPEDVWVAESKQRMYPVQGHWSLWSVITGYLL
jgi:hypothetical protein